MIEFATRKVQGRMFPLLCTGVFSFFFLNAMPVTASTQERPSSQNKEAFLSGERTISGTVEEVRGEQARVNTGETQPRFVPMNLRKEKGLPGLKEGDRVEITVNDQNLIVDVHLPGETSKHRVVRGKLSQPLITGHEKAVIQPSEGKEESHFISSQARSKVASLPVGAEAVFLMDETGKIVDVTFESQQQVDKSQQLGMKKSPLKGNFKKVTGTVKRPLQDNRISINKEDTGEEQYEVRPLIQQKLKKLSPGQTVVLFVDDEEKVTDVSFTEERQE